MEATNLERVDPTGWEAAWCRDCGVALRAQDVVEMDDAGDELMHLGDRCCEIVEAAWVATDPGAAVLVDVGTGEILDFRRDPTDQPFRVTDRDSAEWVLRHIFEAETEAEAKRHRLDVLVENARAEIRRLEREAKWFEHRFGGELEEWARRELEGARTKSVQTPWGRVGFRRKPGRTIVHDDEIAAVSILGEDHPAVKTTHKVLVSKLSSDDVERLRAVIGPDGEPSLVTVEEPSDGFYIQNGAGS